jgi:dienelactone hydrolase
MCADRARTLAVRECEIEAGTVSLPGTLALPANARGVVAFAHGSGSSRLSPRNTLVAEALQRAGLGTLLFDLLTEEEAQDRRLVFDVPLLGERLLAATRWIRAQPELERSALGYFGASTGAAAALWAAAELGDAVAAVVSRGGRPDLAADRLPRVKAPVLLIVGGRDPLVLELNQEARSELRAPSELVVVPGATHLFEEPGALEAVCEHAIEWFARCLVPPSTA